MAGPPIMAGPPVIVPVGLRDGVVAAPDQGPLPGPRARLSLILVHGSIVQPSTRRSLPECGTVSVVLTEDRGERSCGWT